jgi:hypothetical protein
MKRTRKLLATCCAVALGALGSQATAATLTASSAAPVVNGADIANLNSVGEFDPGGPTGHIWSDRPIQGQTFTTAAGGPFFLNSVSLQNEENTVNNSTALFTVRLGTIAGNTFTPVISETATAPASYVPNDYMTFSFTNPVALTPNTLYGFDFGTNGSGFTTWNNADSTYPGGTAYSTGANGVPNNAALTFNGIDRIFHADISGAESFAAGAFGINFTGRLANNTTPDQLRVQSGASTTNNPPAGVPATTRIWNDVPTPGTASGTASLNGQDPLQHATVTWSAPGTWSYSATGSRIVAAENPNGDMKDGHIEGGSTAQATATVSGLSDNFSSYDVYVYVGDDAGGRQGELHFNNGAAQNFTSKLFDGTFTEGTDYFVFHNVTGDSFSVSVGPVGGLVANRTGIQGIEIVGAAVPEPSTFVLGALGLVTLVGVARRRRK